MWYHCKQQSHATSSVQRLSSLYKSLLLKYLWQYTPAAQVVIFYILWTCCSQPMWREVDERLAPFITKISYFRRWFGRVIFHFTSLMLDGGDCVVVVVVESGKALPMSGKSRSMGSEWDVDGDVDKRMAVDDGVVTVQDMEGDGEVVNGMWMVLMWMKAWEWTLHIWVCCFS